MLQLVSIGMRVDESDGSGFLSGDVGGGAPGQDKEVEAAGGLLEA